MDRLLYCLEQQVRAVSLELGKQKVEVLSCRDIHGFFDKLLVCLFFILGSLCNDLLQFGLDHGDKVRNGLNFLLRVAKKNKQLLSAPLSILFNLVLDAFGSESKSERRQSLSIIIGTVRGRDDKTGG